MPSERSVRPSLSTPIPKKAGGQVGVLSASGRRRRTSVNARGDLFIGQGIDEFV